MCKSCIVPSVKFIGVFYYTLANLHPALRSTHRSIQLITVITHPLLKKYGFPEVLKPFINDVRKLYEVCMLCFFVIILCVIGWHCCGKPWK